jgi:hypothetical protein
LHQGDVDEATLTVTSDAYIDHRGRVNDKADSKEKTYGPGVRCMICPPMGTARATLIIRHRKARPVPGRGQAQRAGPRMGPA